jgi:tRNA1Val (adenine37-N6)-methyltransferase
MPNSWFRFKQFTINQEKCAMKVGTDSILLGAWTEFNNPISILDIGSGTGILSLMMAQKYPNANIFGIEIDENSVSQAKENIQNSTWGDRIHIIHSSIQEYSSPVNKFDLIISNPPFFQNSLKAPDLSRSAARHNDEMTQEDLIKGIVNNLSNSGRAFVIWPVKEGEKFIEIAEKSKLFVNRMTFVKPNPSKIPHRVLIELSYLKMNCIADEISIENGKRHKYTEEYKLLTLPFYLNIS